MHHPFLAKPPHSHLIDKIAIVNAIVGAIALYPQVYTLLVYGAGKESLSFISFGLIFSNSLIWLWYGHHRKLTPLMVSSVLNAIASGIIMALLY